MDDVNSLRCIADGCPAPAVYRADGGWVCAAHRDAPADRWVAVTGWNVAYRWAFEAAARAERLSSAEWCGQAGRAGALCVRRGHPEWAPRVERIEQRTFDRATGAATVTVREIDEREHGRAWGYKLRRELFAECLRACGCLPNERTDDSGEQTNDSAGPTSAALLAKSVAAGLQAGRANDDIDGSSAADGGPILSSENPSGLQNGSDAEDDP